MPLTIRQEGFQDIKLWARFDAEPFVLPVYWDWRFSRWEAGKAWEFEVIHHKLYLSNTTPEIQKYNISHGFNMLMFNRVFQKKFVRVRVGAGVILAHPESKIRGKEFGDTGNDMDMGYFISGPVVNFAVSKPFYLGSRFYINAEVKTTFAYSSIKIANGNSDVYNLAFHLNLGPGVVFLKK
ncbi:MAG: hypothetical protein A2066_08575 [Bacteroidetes bacterium GWB2_41_8]|nr:MAG: hypothetical protein A2066_08575 [Bacteroidetes bacterium GWB2_41_8]